MQTFVEELVHRGHEVTCITSQKFNGPKPQNYTEVLIDPPLDMSTIRKIIANLFPMFLSFINNRIYLHFLFISVKETDFFSSMENCPILFRLPIFPRFMKAIADYALNNTNVKKFINRNDLQFDLVINEEIFLDSWLMFGHKFKAPIVTICK